MELKLQQAIVATRAGRTDVAQSLLTQLIRDNPQDANAWFLLGHIVDSPERRARYLRKTLELEPQHIIARKQLLQLQNDAVPAPVLPQQEETHEDVDAHEETTQLEHAGIAVAAATEMAQQTEPEQLPEIHTRRSASPDSAELVGRPVREKKVKEMPQSAAKSEPQGESPALEEQASGEVWLVRILVLMVIVAAIVLGILVLLILI